MPAHIPNRVSTQVRLDETVWNKIKVIAQKENRNANAQLNHFAQQAVEAYEKQYGAVEVTNRSEKR